MKYHLILENAAGEQLDMSTTANRYMMSKVTGLDPPGATISTATYATMNGSQLNRAFLEKRNIVISFEMRGVGVEKRRHRLYRVAKPSEYIKVYYRTSNIDVYTEGVVETCEPSRFDMPVSGQISILCPDVYFYSMQDTIVQHGSIVSRKARCAAGRVSDRQQHHHTEQRRHHRHGDHAGSQRRHRGNADDL